MAVQRNSEDILAREIIHHSKELAAQVSDVYGDQYPLSLLGFSQGDMTFSIHELAPAMPNKALSQYAFRKLGIEQPDFGTRALVAADSPKEKILMYAHNDPTRPPSYYAIDLCRSSLINHNIDDIDRRHILEELPYRYMDTTIKDITYSNCESAQHGEPLLPYIERDSIYYSALESTQQIFDHTPSVNGEYLRSSYELNDQSIYSISYEINLAQSPIGLDKHVLTKEPRIRLTFTEKPDEGAVPRSVAMTITKKLSDIHIKTFIYDQDLASPIVNISDPDGVRELSSVMARLHSSLKYNASSAIITPKQTGRASSIARPVDVDFSVKDFIDRQLDCY